ncbi:MAG: UDP-3-O-(3-hydroxymyristoyl)glucosamine N-acyltransferase [Candidatus Zixiibacteriota bacterium]|nr:MAG: UDP-3-O-(3-hydroxymyristoyl)glucosamine N-acyltransferase [candidate division Zixibacteria bacterium]
MPFKLGRVAKEIGAELNGDPDLVINNLAPIEEASEGELSFIAGKKHRKLLEKTKASALIVYPGLKSDTCSLLILDDPQLGFARAMRLFYSPYPEVNPGVEKSAIIAEGINVPSDCYIGHNAVISSGVGIGNGVEIHAGAFVGENVKIGDGSRLYQNVTVCRDVMIGGQVVIYPNAVIGSEGFGYAREDNRHVKIPQIGTVIIEDYVEIGAGTTIDRATLGATVIGKGAIIDNLVQIAHNCRIGRGAILCAQVGLAGSTIVGENAILAGQVGVAGHLTVGNGAILQAQSGVASDIPDGSVQFGTPSREAYLAHKIEAILNKLPDYISRIKQLESKLKNNS